MMSHKRIPSDKPTKGVRERVIAHYAWMSKTMPEYKAQRMAELAPGIIAVKDRSGECDALFDTTVWKFNSAAWQPTESPELRAAKLDVLPGKGSARPISTINDMATFAREHLIALNRVGNNWHKKPQYFEHQN